MLIYVKIQVFIICKENVNLISKTWKLYISVSVSTSKQILRADTWSGLCYKKSFLREQDSVVDNKY